MLAGVRVCYDRGMGSSVLLNGNTVLSRFVEDFPAT